MSGARLSTPAVATVAGAAARRVPGLQPVDPASSLCAPAATCRCAPGDNLALHRLLFSAPAGSVLVCAAGGDVEHGYFGELASADAVNRGLGGLVIDGAVRDAAAVEESGFPVFARGLAPHQCAKDVAHSVGEPVELAGVRVALGDIVVADRDGVVVVAAADWPTVAREAEALEAREVELRAAIARGERLADLLGVDLGDGA